MSYNQPNYYTNTSPNWEKQTVVINSVQKYIAKTMNNNPAKELEDGKQYIAKKEDKE